MFPLLRTKTSIPPTRPRQIVRERLLARVRAGMHRALTLLVAPAGSGKTTLAAGWARQAGMPVAWLTLEPGDITRERFLTYLIQALQTIHPAVGQTSLALLQGGPAGGLPEGALVALVNDMAGVPITGSQTGDFALILDDYHTVDGPEPGEVVQFLLDHRPARFHLALTSRTAPGLALARLRALDQVTEIGGEDLRFTPSEAHEFLATCMDLQLDPIALARLEQSHLFQANEGWAVGLQLAALALARRPGDWNAPAGQARIFEYLAEEVLRRESPEVQDFLMVTALFDRFCAPLCAAIFSDVSDDELHSSPETSIKLLNYVEQSNLFLVALDESATWFRYHALFADFLRARIDPAHAARIYHAASRWFERSGLLEDALHYAVHSNDLDRAVELFESQYRALLQRGQQAVLREHLAAFPEDQFTHHPRLWLARGWTAIIGLNASEAEDCAARATALVQPGPSGDALRGEAQALRLLSGIFAGRVSTLAEIEQARALLEREDEFLHGLLHFNLGLHAVMDGETAQAVEAFTETLRLARFADNPLVAIVAWVQLGETRQMRGALGLAERAFQQVIRAARETLGEHTFLLGMPFVSYAEVLREQNRLEEAERCARQGIEYCQVWQPVASLDGRICLARLAAGQGRFTEAIRHLEDALDVAEHSLSVIDDTFVAIYMARLHLLNGSPIQAARWIQAYELESPASDRYYTLQEMIQLVLLRWRVDTLAPDSQSAPETQPALALAEEIAVLAVEAGRRERVTPLIETLLLRAYALHAGQANPAEVIQTLTRALTLGAQSGYVRIFADEGPRLLALLEQYPPAAPRGYVEEIKTVLRKETGLRAPIPKPAPIPGEREVGPESFAVSSQPPPAGDAAGGKGFPLTRRELDILRQMAAGMTNQEIAAASILTLNTVKKHVANILAKLEVANRTQAVLLAQQKSWLKEE